MEEEKNMEEVVVEEEKTEEKKKEEKEDVEGGVVDGKRPSLWCPSGKCYLCEVPNCQVIGRKICALDGQLEALLFPILTAVKSREPRFPMVRLPIRGWNWFG